MMEPNCTAERPSPAAPARTVLDVTVSNHPGVMVHVCSLFARRNYNMEGIVCLPVDDGATSRVWILVDEDRRLEQVERQLMKLEDVVAVRRRSASRELPAALEALFASAAPA